MSAQVADPVTIEVSPTIVEVAVTRTVVVAAAPLAELAVVTGGIQGASAYAVAVANGFAGTAAQWLASLVGPAGASSPDATPHPFSNVASFTFAHGLPYFPATTVVTPDGAVMDTDTFHAPGQVTVVFAAPTSGTLYLG